MVSKKITVSLLFITAAISNNHLAALSNSSYAESYKGKNSDYRYLEFYFVEQPRNALNEHIKKARGLALTSIISTVLVNEYFKTSVDNVIKYPIFNNKFDISSIAIAILALTGFDVYTSIQEDAIKKDALIKFITNWDFHKQFIPTSLIPAFDELATTFNNSESKTFSNEEVNAIFEIIQHLLEHEFSGRYSKEKKKDADTLGLFKTITDINKNLK